MVDANYMLGSLYPSAAVISQSRQQNNCCWNLGERGEVAVSGITSIRTLYVHQKLRASYRTVLVVSTSLVFVSNLSKHALARECLIQHD